MNAMSKKHEKPVADLTPPVADAPKADAPKADAPTTDAPKPEPKLTVKAGQKYRGARQAWYERMLALEGKDRKDVLADLEAKRPSMYGAKSKHAGTPEPVAGWVRFFERTGVASWK